MTKEFLELGQIVSTHGVKGEVRLNPWCDSTQFAAGFGAVFFDENGKEPVKVTSARPHGNIVILKLFGVDSVSEAQRLKGKILYINRKDCNLEDGQYFICDLIGCEVFNADSNKKYGDLCDVSKTGANDVWHIKDANDKEYLIPAIPQVVAGVDIENNVVKIRPLRGIFDED